MQVIHKNGDKLGIIDSEISPRVGEFVTLNNTKFKVIDIEYCCISKSISPSNFAVSLIKLTVE